MRARVVRLYMLAALGLTLFLLVALAGFEIFPFTNGNNDFSVTGQANYQIARDQLIAKDALALADPKTENRAQYIGEMQIVVPQFQQVQTGLQNGDPVIGLPPNPPDNEQIALAATQSDYLAILSASKAILAKPDAPAADPVQVSIIRQHERPYLTSMAQVVALISANAQGRRLQLFLIEMSLKGAIGLLVMLKYLLFTRGVIDKMVASEAAQAQGKEQIE